MGIFEEMINKAQEWLGDDDDANREGAARSASDRAAAAEAEPADRPLEATASDAHRDNPLDGRETVTPLATAATPDLTLDGLGGLRAAPGSASEPAVEEARAGKSDSDANLPDPYAEPSDVDLPAAATAAGAPVDAGLSDVAGAAADPAAANTGVQAIDAPSADRPDADRPDADRPDADRLDADPADTDAAEPGLPRIDVAGAEAPDVEAAAGAVDPVAQSEADIPARDTSGPVGDAVHAAVPLPAATAAFADADEAVAADADIAARPADPFAPQNTAAGDAYAPSGAADAAVSPAASFAHAADGDATVTDPSVAESEEAPGDADRVADAEADSLTESYADGPAERPEIHASAGADAQADADADTRVGPALYEAPSHTDGDSGNASAPEANVDADRSEPAGALPGTALPDGDVSRGADVPVASGAAETPAAEGHDGLTFAADTAGRALFSAPAYGVEFVTDDNGEVAYVADVEGRVFRVSGVERVEFTSGDDGRVVVIPAHTETVGDQA
jgi:hypothetical protein